MRAAKTAFLASTLIAGCCVSALSGAGAEAPKTENLQQIIDGMQRAPVAYQAVRRLEASNPKLHESAWLEAFTEYDSAAGFRYRIMGQGGSERIRTKVLQAVLDVERDSFMEAEQRKTALNRDNYDFNLGGRTADGMIELQLNPRRRDARLVDGSAWVSPQARALVRLQGRLSKSPSFWVKWVDVTRHYRDVHGVMMPVALESTADLRFFGLSTFSMQYEYATVNGQAIVPATILASR